MARMMDAILRLRDRVLGPHLRSYDDAREELGGMPWRPFSATERWFLPQTPAGAGAESRPVTLDTGALLLLKPSILDRLRETGRAGWLVAGLVVVVLAVGLLARSSAAPAPAPVAAAAAAAPAAPAPVAQPAPAAAAAPAAPAVAKTEPAHMSSSVRALFAGGGKPSHAAHGKRHRK